MKRLLVILSILFATLPVHAQHVARAMREARARQEAAARAEYFREEGAQVNRAAMMPYFVDSDGDTCFIAQLEPAWCFGHNKGRKKDWRQYYKKVYYFAKVYPLALASGRISEMVDSTIAAQNMGAMKRDRYIASVQDQLFKDFETTLRDMSINQGAVLLKLIDRETGRSGFSIIKQYKNGIAAGFWQGVARFFDNDLKSEYDPTGEDKDLEELVHYWEEGTFKDLYYSIFFDDPPVVKVPDKYLN